MKEIDQKLKQFSRQNNSILPTPGHKLDNLSNLLDRNIYCKRDDMTGFGLGGNKTRKLDYLISHAIEQGANTLIAVGANQSNFCRMAAATGRVHNLDVHLVLGGAEPEHATGNLLIDQMLGTERHHVLSNEWEKWEEEAALLEKHLTGIGRRVYRMPVGGSTPIGALGYVHAFSEIMDDAKKMKVSFDTIIHASSSAGTQAGLVVGKEIAGWPGRIIGISVSKSKEALEEEVQNLAISTGRLLETNINRQSVIVDAMYLGEKYAVPTTEGEEAIKLFARNSGIFLDHVYTGKAAAALIDYARDNRIEKDENVLFIHTGGNIELFE